MERRKLICYLLLCIFILGVSASSKKDRNKKPYRMVCYLGSWANYRNGNGEFKIENIDPNKCTHIIYGFAKLENTSKTIEPYDPWLDLPDNWGLDAYGRFNKLRLKNPELTTLIAIGGWNEGSAKYSEMASSPVTRKIFVDSVLHFLKKYDFDGLDFDWEYPGSREGSRPEDKENFLLVIKELHDAFEHEGYLLTSAVSAGRETIDLAYAIPKITELMDFINIMTYDFHGGWEDITGHNAPLYARPDENEKDSHLNTDYGVNYWLKNGANPKKLVMGMPLYGRCFTLKDPSVNGFNAPVSGKGKEGPYTREAGTLGYNEICEMFQKEKWQIVLDKYHRAPYAYSGNQWCGYDDVESIVVKTNYLKEKGLSGGMVWSLETDDFRGHCHGYKYPLLSAINDRLNNKEVTIPDPNVKPDGWTSDYGHTVQPEQPKCTKEGSFPYENDCTRFYQCIIRHFGFDFVERRCPPGTAFHPEKQSCMFPSEVPGCGKGTNVRGTTSRPATSRQYTTSRPATSRQYTTARPATSRQYTTARPATSRQYTTARPATSRQYTTARPATSRQYTTSRPLTTVQVPTTVQTTFVCPSEGIFPHPTDCKSFYKCGPGQLGLRDVVFTCPMYLYYNPKILSCDYAENVDCTDRSSKKPKNVLLRNVYNVI